MSSVVYRDNIMMSRSRRRPPTTPGDMVPSEQSPLEVDRQSPSAVSSMSSTSYFSDYSTFSSRATTTGTEMKQREQVVTKPPVWWSIVLSHFIACIQGPFGPPDVTVPLTAQNGGGGDNDKRPQLPGSPPTQQDFSCKLLSGLFLCVIVALYHMSRDSVTSDYPEPEWQWDHNVYNPRFQQQQQQHQQSVNKSQAVKQQQQQQAIDTADSDAAGGSRKSHNLLLAQVAGTPTLDELALISSRPNRAYSRQWGRDYVRYSNRKQSLAKACFDKALVLDTVMEKQQSRVSSVGDSGGGLWPPSPSQRGLVQYDVVALLPPDVIIMDLDYDMLKLMPADRLVSISGWTVQDSASRRPYYSGTEIVLFNMRHKLARKVSRQWWDRVQPADVTCGAGNDLTILINVIRSFLSKGEELSSLIYGLEETDQGFVGKDSFVLKGIAPSVPASKAVILVSKLAEARATLQTTADAVCYRFYPKCDVL